MSELKPCPTKPGYYWALWITASPDTHEGSELTPSTNWEVVEVWENVVDPCEADYEAGDVFGVSVPGVRETQWLENFQWGEGPIEAWNTRADIPRAWWERLQVYISTLYDDNRTTNDPWAGCCGNILEEMDRIEKEAEG